MTDPTLHCARQDAELSTTSGASAAHEALGLTMADLAAASALLARALDHAAAAEAALRPAAALEAIQALENDA